MGNKSCNLFIEGKGRVSVSIDEHPSMPSMSFTGLQGRGVGRVVEEKAAIRCALRQAGFDIPMAKDGLERSLDDLCDEKQAEADLVEGNEGRETRFESKETGR